MYPHHQRTIDRITEHFQQDPTALALIIGGSVAKGWAAESSDVDFVLVVSEAEFARRSASGQMLYYSTEFSDYEGGYVDGKFEDLAFLEEVADHGNEVARAAFYHTWAAFSRDPRIDDLIQRIPVYPEAERDAKLKAFYSEVVVTNWMIGEAVKRNDKYLLTHAASEMALFGGRLMLAYNRILYPYHKWFTHEVERAPEKPDDFMDLFHALLDQPGTATAQAFCDAITAYRDWGVSFGETFVNFTRDREWNWRNSARADPRLVENGARHVSHPRWARPYNDRVTHFLRSAYKPRKLWQHLPPILRAST